MKFAIDNGMIDMSFVQEQIEMKKRENLLNKHPYKIWKGKDSKWYTYIPDEDKGRKLLKRRTKNEVEDEVVAYWKIETENPTIKDIFYEWMERKLEY